MLRGMHPVDLYEYQARDLFEKHGVPVLGGVVAEDPAAAKAAAEQLGTPVVVVKAQVKTGGRGKAGGVKIAKSPEEAEQKASEILGMDIKGHTVHRVMIAAGADIAEEYYFSLLLDRANRNYLAMCSVEGGMEIEQLAVERPEALARVAVDPNVGIDQAKAEEIVAAAKFDAETGAKVAPVLVKLWDVYQNEDATLVEVNPLVRPVPGTSWPWTARSRSTSTPGSATRTTPLSSTSPPRTRWRPRPRPWTSTTSSPTARSASSATARAWSCPPSTSSRMPVSPTASSPRTSSTSAAAPPPGSCPTSPTPSSATSRSPPRSAASSAASPRAAPPPTASTAR